MVGGLARRLRDRPAPHRAAMSRWERVGRLKVSQIRAPANAPAMKPLAVPRGSTVKHLAHVSKNFGKFARMGAPPLAFDPKIKLPPLPRCN